ncbi:ATP-binding protein [Clostridiaceae bacterium M8S5]|nr:ATP-binding protein [Clostridiaceae bacterium M8S5]
MMHQDKRIRIITGHYGSGKTEFSVNYALGLAKVSKKLALADLDIVNPYFRSREKTELLENNGIRVISSSLKGINTDVPALSAAINAPLEDKEYDVILDVGGDPVGARVLGRYNKFFVDNEYDMFLVVNANRPETQTVEGVLEYIKSIENASRLKITGLINNTHLLKSTTVEDVLRGQKLVQEVSKITNLDIRYTSVIESLVSKLPADIEGELIKIKMYMREDWMS